MVIVARRRRAPVVLLVVVLALIALGAPWSPAPRAQSPRPAINRQGELVGIIFDGNIQSLVLDYIYTDQQARAVAVHSAGILEALRKIYAANRLVNELTAAR